MQLSRRARAPGVSGDGKPSPSSALTNHIGEVKRIHRHGIRNHQARDPPRSLQRSWRSGNWYHAKDGHSIHVV